jgi:hypothetical protein
MPTPKWSKANDGALSRRIPPLTSIFVGCIFVGLVGHPGLDPGTLGLKVQVKPLQSASSCCIRSQNCWCERTQKDCARDSLEGREMQCNEVVGTSALPVGGH